MAWRTILSDTYVPSVLFFRDKQLQTLIRNPNKNYYCEGDKSTGKTVTAFHLKLKLENPNQMMLYVQCQRALTLQFAEAVAGEGIAMKWEDRQHPTLTVFKKTEKPKVTIILDDVQKVTYFKIFNNFLHDLYENAHACKKDLRMVLIGTSSYRMFQESLRDDVKSRLRLEYLYYPKYDGKELISIFKQRLDLAALEYEIGAVNYVSAKIMRLVTDIREGLKMLREVCEKVCENGQQTQPITLTLVKQMWIPHKINYWLDHMKGLYWHEKALLFCATKLVMRRKVSSPFQIHPELTITTININKLYRKFCYQMKEQPLYIQRVSYILGNLCKHGFLLRENVVSFGRKGRTTKYIYAVNPETIYQVFQKMEGWQ